MGKPGAFLASDYEGLAGDGIFEVFGASPMTNGQGKFPFRSSKGFFDDGQRFDTYSGQDSDLYSRYVISRPYSSRISLYTGIITV